MILIHQRYRQTDRQTDGRTTCNLNTALCTSASRGKNSWDKKILCILFKLVYEKQQLSRLVHTGVEIARLFVAVDFLSLEGIEVDGGNKALFTLATIVSPNSAHQCGQGLSRLRFLFVDFDASVDRTLATINKQKTVNVLVSSDVRNKENKMTRLYVRVEQQTLYTTCCKSHRLITFGTGTRKPIFMNNDKAGLAQTIPNLQIGRGWGRRSWKGAPNQVAVSEIFIIYSHTYRLYSWFTVSMKVNKKN